MPNLTQDQLKKLESQLRERQQMLTEEVSEKRHDTASASTEEVMGGVGDPGDESVAREQVDLALEEAARDTHELHEIEAALARIADGSYGTCIDCDIDIDYRRLQAQPAAVRCVECQSKREKTFAHRETPSL